MRKTTVPILWVFLCMACGWPAARGQADKGAIEINARITPTAARPEPVRQFTFYLLTRSYSSVTAEIGAQHLLPERDAFIDTLKVSKELKAWLKAHDILDLTMPGLDKALTADDIVKTPEFLLAYQHSNSGGVTKSIPIPKYKDTDKADHPDKYKKDYDDYISQLKKFIQAHPETVSGVELELYAINPAKQWAQIGSDQRKAVQHLAPDVAQTKYLAGTVDTDLNGHAVLTGVAPGNYWISTLNLDASAGDARLRWDVPVTVEAGRTTRIDLTNLNAADNHTASAP
jgi:hypothetical protein